VTDVPLVSVVIPIFNGERFIAAAIASARGQDHPAVEIIVSDDGSTDASFAEAERAGADRILQGPNGGPAAARNRALEVVRGEYVCFLDADDVMKPEKISRQVGFLEENASKGVVLTAFETFIEEGVEPPTIIRMQLEMQQGRTPFAAMSALVRREVFERVGNFDTGYRVGSDTEWLWRVKEAGIGIGQIDEPLFIRGVHGGNITYEDSAVRSGLLRAARAHLRRGRAGAPDGLGDPQA
jgi:glycosyltransferase involved in cell wall biosynthesis